MLMYYIENLLHINKKMFLLTCLLCLLVLISGTTQDADDNSLPSNQTIVVVCKDEGKLNQVEIWKDNQIRRTCRLVKIYNFRLSLRARGIMKFETDWYQLQNLPVDYINLSDNNVTEVTSTLLNNLPTSVKSVVLAHNQIVNLKEGIIQNEHIRRLTFDSNLISKIEDRAFSNTQLTMLTIQNNKLNDTKFVATLPMSLEILKLENNQITEISDGCFSKLNKLANLTLGHNKITVIPATFSDGLSALTNLDLGYNSIVHLDQRVLADLKNIRVLNLQFNKIENLEAGVFVNFPNMNRLHLEGNNISNIENGSFNLPQLRYLNLSHNALTCISKDTFRGFDNLVTFDLTFNRITEIEMKSFVEMGKVNYLDISNNPVIKPGGSGKWIML